VVTDNELERIVDTVAGAVETATAAVRAATAAS
jgi:hypothetical protein